MITSTEAFVVVASGSIVSIVTWELLTKLHEEFVKQETIKDRALTRLQEALDGLNVIIQEEAKVEVKEEK